MDTTPASPSPAPESSPALSLGARALAIFARPTQAWGGLERRGQWWFPLLITVVVTVIGSVATYQRAAVPTNLAMMEQRVEAGSLDAAHYEAMEQWVSSPLAMWIQGVSVLIGLPLVTLAFALIPWIGVGFMMGQRFRFRDAFVVTAWTGLVALPNQILTFVLAWVSESMMNIHTGFGVLLPSEETPSRLMTGLGAFLDQGIGPFSIWYVAVMALGAAALSGAPRRRVLMTIGGLWLVVTALLAVMAGFFGRGA